MDERALEQNYSWNQSLEEIFKKLIQNPPDTPHYQKLALLAQLKAGVANENTAQTLAAYTKWLMFLTWFIAGGTIIQAIFVVLAYFSPTSH